MALNLYKGAKPPESFYVDIASLRQIPADKLSILLEFVFKLAVDDAPATDEVFKRLAKQTEVTLEVFLSAARVINNIMTRAPSITREELKSDLSKVELKEETIAQILLFLEAQKTKLYRYIERARREAVPSLTDINWRVDIRSASGDALPEPTVYVLMRIAVNDGTRTDRIYMELNKDDLSWLETTLSKIKAAFMKAEEIKARIVPAISEETKA